MSTPATSHAELCRSVLALHVARLFEATYNPEATHPDLPAGETGILESFTPDGLRFVFGVSGFSVPGHGFIPYQDAVGVDWAGCKFDEKKDHENYLMIVFRDRPPITVYVGDQSVPLIGLIKTMKMLTDWRPIKD